MENQSNSDSEERFFDCCEQAECLEAEKQQEEIEHKNLEQNVEVNMCRKSETEKIVDELIEKCTGIDVSEEGPSCSKVLDPEEGPECPLTDDSGPLKIDEEHLKELESLMTDEQKEKNRTEALELKSAGNTKFGERNYEEAIEIYTKALILCPPSFDKERAMFYGNRAACHMKLEDYEMGIEDCSKALEMDGDYLKVLSRRAWCYEKKEDNWDKALDDYKKVLQLDPENKAARTAVQRLPPMIQERNERMKQEMIGKLKDLGNMVLRPFGLSTDNFKLEPNEEGGYSVQLQR